MKPAEPSPQALYLGLAFLALILALPLLWFARTSSREAFDLGPGTPAAAPTSAPAAASDAPASGTDALQDITPPASPSDSRRPVPAPPSAILPDNGARDGPLPARPLDAHAAAGSRAHSFATAGSHASPSPTETEYQRQTRLWYEGIAAGIEWRDRHRNVPTEEQIAALAETRFPHDLTAEIIWSMGFAQGQRYVLPRER